MKLKLFGYEIECQRETEPERRERIIREDIEAHGEWDWDGDLSRRVEAQMARWWKSVDREKKLEEKGGSK